MTRIIADTHVHLYPVYDRSAALAALDGNLGRHGAGVRAAFLADRRDSRVFAAMRSGSFAVPGGGYEIRPLAEEGAVVACRDGEPRVYLFAGRQIVTAERIEVLALTVDLDLEDGLPAARVVDTILEAGGVPVLGWSPGKWWFARGALVAGLLRGRRPGEILLGDTALRPAGTREPRLMREARSRGFAVAAGTDALPLPGEERLLGSYVTVLEGEFDAGRPQEAVRRLLRGPGPALGTSGERGSWGSAARRWVRNARAAHA
jgi:hypothetical protein